MWFFCGSFLCVFLCCFCPLRRARDNDAQAVRAKSKNILRSEILGSCFEARRVPVLLSCAALCPDPAPCRAGYPMSHLTHSPKLPCIIMYTRGTLP